jgi:uncharacterized protein with HEPN domain
MDKEIRIKKLLFDIQSCIENIESYIGESKIFNDYSSNHLLQDAVERNLITIGEAINSLLKEDNSIPISNARRIVNARNKLTHGYDEIENVQVWSIIVKDIPVLKKEINSLLAD